MSLVDSETATSEQSELSVFIAAIREGEIEIHEGRVQDVNVAFQVIREELGSDSEFPLRLKP